MNKKMNRNRYRFMSYSVILVFLLFGMLPYSASAAISVVERNALIELYNATDGDSWTNNSGWKDGPLEIDGFAMSGTECSWYGHWCSDNIHVAQINLDSNNLAGFIPPEIGNLSHLLTLSLERNHLSGSIPPELGELTNLSYLGLFNNQLSGSIPPELGNLINLGALQLSDNQLSGAIPPELGNLTKLCNLSLATNQLSGPIPRELGQLTNLWNLVLYDNQLSGPIPPELGNLDNMYLDSLMLSTNRLTGPIPPELGNLINAKGLYLEQNRLTGLIPPELGNLINLQFLHLDENQLSGEIPSTITNLSNLSSLDIGYNCLYTANQLVRTYLDSKDPDWETIQTCASFCGNGILQTGEECDDGNVTSGNGCSATCTIESGYTCSGSPSVCSQTPPPPVTMLLTVNKSGSGSGIVISTPVGISCGADCSEPYANNTAVTLTPQAANGSTFTQWTGACSGTGTCQVTMDAAKSVTASFTLNQQPTTLTPGENVVITPVPEVRLTFPTVTTPGSITITELVNPSPPANFRVITGSSYQIVATGDFTFPVTVCMSYSNSALADSRNEGDIKLFHHNGTSWEDITTSVDMVNNIVCGLTYSFSPFILAEPTTIYSDSATKVPVQNGLWLIPSVLTGLYLLRRRKKLSA